jgi:hypothetical protein
MKVRLKQGGKEKDRPVLLNLPENQNVEGLPMNGDSDRALALAHNQRPLPPF